MPPPTSRTLTESSSRELRSRGVATKTMSPSATPASASVCASLLSQRPLHRSRVVGGTAEWPATRCDAPDDAMKTLNRESTLSEPRAVIGHSGSAGACTLTCMALL